MDVVETRKPRFLEGAVDAEGPLWPLVVTSFLALVVLYAPQPLLPRWADVYGIPETRVALVIAVALVPLAIAPLAGRPVLRRWTTVRVLRGATVLLAVCVGATALRPSFPVLLGIRVGQGLAIAALLTALMTHISQVTRGGSALRRLMSVYVAATILGGFLGRLGAGITAEIVSDRWFFVGCAVLLLVSDLGLRRLPQQRRSPAPGPSSSSGTAWTAIWKRREVVRIYAFVFCLFFVFSAMMNFLPFRLQDIEPTASGALTGGVYAGYLVGVGTSLGSSRLTHLLGGPTAALLVGGLGLLGSLAAALIASVAWLLGAIGLLCAAFFLAHTVAASRVNERGADDPSEAGGAQEGGLVNGLYVSIYYTGGVLGAYLPGFVYDAYGWTGFLLCLAIVAGAGLAVGVRWEES